MTKALRRPPRRRATGPRSGPSPEDLDRASDGGGVASDEPRESRPRPVRCIPRPFHASAVQCRADGPPTFPRWRPRTAGPGSAPGGDCARASSAAWASVRCPAQGIDTRRCEVRRAAAGHLRRPVRSALSRRGAMFAFPSLRSTTTGRRPRGSGACQRQEPMHAPRPAV